MYSEQIEQLIKSVIADGVITEKERAVLHKKAAAEGIDEDEIDVYVDGLITQMKSDTSKSKVPVSANIDFNHVTKFIGSQDRIYYLGQKHYHVGNLTNVPIQSIYLNFFKEIKKETNKNRFGISIAFIFKKGISSYGLVPSLEFKTDTNRIQLHRDCIHSLQFPPNLKQGSLHYDICTNYFDEEMLKLLCDTEHVIMTLTGCGVAKDDYTDKREIDLKDISVDGLATYAQVFYRSIVDNSAYPDAVINEKELSGSKVNDNELFSIDDQKVIRLITKKKKKYEQIKPCPSCYKQYKSVNDVIIAHVNSTVGFEGKDQEIKLEALTDNKGNTRFFLVWISRWRENKMKITVNMNDYQLMYLADGDKKKENYADDNNYSFFEVDNSLLIEMFRTKHDILFNNLKVNRLPKKWHEAFDYLTDPQKLIEWKEQYEENDQSGFFGKLKNFLG